MSEVRRKYSEDLDFWFTKRWWCTRQQITINHEEDELKKVQDALQVTQVDLDNSNADGFNNIFRI